MNGLETVYRKHHAGDAARVARKRNHACLAEERKAFFQKYLPVEGNILDVGCRDGELIKYYNDKNQYNILGLDVDSEALEIARNKIDMETKWCDLNAEWEVEKDAYDGVVAGEVIEHLYYPAVIFERIDRVLKPGGVLVGSVPNAFNIQTRVKLFLGTKYLTPLSDPTHINHFSVSEMRGLLEKQFTNVEIKCLATPKYHWLSNVFPSVFTHTMMFKAVKKS